MTPITVVIADREKASRAACLRLLRPEKGIRVVGEARSGLEAIAAAKLKPRILLLDVHMAAGNGVALLRILRQKSPRTKVILLTRRASQARILDVLAHGARGYLDKKAFRTFLLPKAVRLVDAGQAWVPRKMVAKILDRLAHLTA
ncbi:MAG: response regulator transcription factor [candidate division NC10 bacterium]|nr:response regulator transcription factor [candidate division NC10 bacterium]MBI4413049.1 response regulator transcription factor [candidate division NC10 bacterium]